MTPMRWLPAMCSLGIAACAATPGAPSAPPAAAAAPAAAASPPASLAGTRWVALAEGDPQTLPRIEFTAPGRLTGYSGCNMMSGTWRMDGDVIRIGPIVTTKRMCVGPGGEMERRLLAALGGRAAREGGKLVFFGPGGERFEFTPALAS